MAGMSAANEALIKEEEAPAVNPRGVTYSPPANNDSYLSGTAQATQSQLLHAMSEARAHATAPDTSAPPVAVTPPAANGGGPGTGTGSDLTGPGGTTGPTATSIAGSASAIITDWAQGVGLGALSGWISSQATQLAAEGFDGSQIASQIESTINSAPGFDALFPGYNQRMKNGYSNAGGIAAYVQYQDQLSELAHAAGLPQGFMSADTIGNLWANDVSASEATTRINQGYADAMSAPQQVRDFLQRDYGLSTGGLAAYYLDPKQSLTLLQQNFNTASVQAGAQMSGFDSSLSEAQARTLAAFLQGGTDANGMPNQINAGQAANALTQSLGPGMTGAAQMSNAGFTHANPGMAANGPGVVTEQQLLSGVEGDANALASIRLATGTRTAATQGGGGFASDQTGIAGIGSGSMA